MDASAILAISTYKKTKFLLIFNLKTIRRRFKFQRFQKRDEGQFRINEHIRVPRVLVIDDSNQNLGEMDTAAALELARSLELDLIEVFPKAVPPVCRIMDYGKIQYQKSKEIRLSRAKQKKIDTKGIRIGVRTDEHDLEFKKSQADKFLKKGDKVKIEIILRGREKAHQDLARDNMQKFASMITTPYKIEEPIKRFPGGFNMIIAPE